nr:o-succinylbenzoate synthase [Corynebacterium sp. 13CS0277]
MVGLLAAELRETIARLDFDELLDRAHVVALPMRVRFRGIETREAVLIDGPAGWGEFAPFVEYSPEEAAWWLASALEAAYVGLPAPARDYVEINATVPAVPAEDVAGVLARFPGCRTVKVKVAEPGQTFAQDVARVAAVRALLPEAKIRIDGNRNLSVAAAQALIRAVAPLDYAEQPVAGVEELGQVRAWLGATGIAARVAADESIRRAEDPLAIAATGAVDAAVLKVAPLGGVRRLLALAERLPFEITVASALDTAVGMSAGLVAASHLPPVACGLGTGGLFVEDVARPRRLVGGRLSTAPVTPDPARVAGLAAPYARQNWWVEHLRQSYQALRLRLQA